MPFYFHRNDSNHVIWCIINDVYSVQPNLQPQARRILHNLPVGAKCSQRINELLHKQSPLIAATLPGSAQAVAKRYAAQLIALKPSEAVVPQGVIERFLNVDLDSVEWILPRNIGVERSALSAMRSYDVESKLSELGPNRPQIAATVASVVATVAHPVRAIFGLHPTITLYGLTNTCFEGGCCCVAKAKCGHSKESRCDCLLVRLAVTIDASGFVLRSKVFAGNASEPATLKDMLTRLNAAPGSAVVMEAGIATELSLIWLRERQFDPEGATEVQAAGDVTFKMNWIIGGTKAVAFVAACKKTKSRLSKPHGAKKMGAFIKRIGRVNAAHPPDAQHYEVQVTRDETPLIVLDMSWSKRIKAGSAAVHLDVNGLRMNLLDVGDATLWRTYVMLTDLALVCRLFKTGFGLRPVFHQVEHRVNGHFFISVLACPFVHMPRTQFKNQGIEDSCSTWRETLSVQRRATAFLRHHSRSKPPAGHRVFASGFSLIELMVVMAIVAILAGIAAPSFSELIRNNRLSSASSALQVSLSLARSEAVKRGADSVVTVAANGASGQWVRGWTVFVDKTGTGNLGVGPTTDDTSDTGWTRLEVVGAPSAPVNFGPTVSPPTYFSFNGQGRMFRVSGASVASYSLWFFSGTSQKYCLIVNNTGRVRTQRVDYSENCPDA